MPSLIELAVTPGPSVFDTTAGAVLPVVPPGVVVVLFPPVLALLLLPHAAPTSASNTTNATRYRRPFMRPPPK